MECTHRNACLYFWAIRSTLNLLSTSSKIIKTRELCGPGQELCRSNGVQPNFYSWGGREIGRGEGGIEGKEGLRERLREGKRKVE